IGHLTDQLILYSLRRKAPWGVKYHQDVLEQRRKINARTVSGHARIPDPGTGPTQAGQLLDLGASEAGIEHVRYRWQQELDRLLHAADVGLGHGVAISLEASGKL